MQVSTTESLTGAERRSPIAKSTSISVLASNRGRPATAPSGAELDRLRVLIVHDWLVAWGGAERCLEQLLRVFPQADLAVSLISPSMRHLNEATSRARETWLGTIPGARNHHRWLLPLEGLAFATLDTTGYDLVVSSSHAFAKMVRTDSHTLHLCYCYTPPRYLWDLYETYKSAARGLQRFALVAAAGALRRLDRWSAQRVDRFVAISRCVADRIQRCYGRPADVVFPPVASKTALPERAAKRDSFLLYLGRLVPYKRVDLAMAAAERLGMRLVVAGDGPERARLQQLAGPMTQFAGIVSEEEAGSLLSSCTLFLFCSEDDFGIAPLEANAHATPVVAYGRGGALETLQQGVTAEFFYEQTTDAVVRAARQALSRQWDEEALVQNARRFSPDRFREAFVRCVNAALESR